MELLDLADALASLRWSKELKAGRDGVVLRATSLVHCQEASLVGDDLSRSPPTGVTQGKIRSSWDPTSGPCHSRSEIQVPGKLDRRSKVGTVVACGGDVQVGHHIDVITLPPCSTLFLLLPVVFPTLDSLIFQGAWTRHGSGMAHNYGDYGTMELVFSIAQSDLLRMNGRALELWKAEAESDSKCFISHDIFAIPQYIPLQDRIAKEDTPSLSLFPPTK